LTISASDTEHITAGLQVKAVKNKKIQENKKINNFEADEEEEKQEKRKT
jgi:hypothetical protein